MLAQFTTATTMGMRQHLRNALFVVLLVGLPIAFISLSFARTPNVPFAVSVPEGGTDISVPVGMRNLHGAIMVPMTVSFLAGILGMFVMIVSREGDRRLVRSGFSARNLLLSRLAVIGGLSFAITVISVFVTLFDYRPEQLGLFFLVNLISALQYAFIGAAVGMFLSPMSGTYLMFFAPMIDVGLVQNPMFPRDAVAWWVKLLPSYWPMEVLTDVSFSASFDEGRALAITVAYLAAVGLVGVLAFQRTIVGPR